MKVSNEWGVPNQLVIELDNGDVIFQSYDSTIVIKRKGKVILGNNWDYSQTTGKYRNLFLGETKAETAKKIKSGEYVIDETL